MEETGDTGLRMCKTETKEDMVRIKKKKLSEGDEYLHVANKGEKKILE